MQINGPNLRTLNTTFNTSFRNGFTGAETSYRTIATIINSTTKSNEYGWLGKVPKVREWLGDRVVHGLNAHDYTIKNRSFELTLGVDRDDIEDDNLGVYAPMFQDMGMSASEHPDELVWELMNASFDTPCYDGQNFFDTDHPVLDEDGAEQSVSNMQAGSGPAWYIIDDTRPLKPIIFQSRKSFEFVAMDSPDDPDVFKKKEFQYGVDGRDNVGFGLWQFAFGSKAPLNSENYQAARKAMGEFRGDYGRKMTVKPRKLIVPRSLEKEGLELLNAERNAAGATNVWRGTAELQVEDWLDG